MPTAPCNYTYRYRYSWQPHGKLIIDNMMIPISIRWLSNSKNSYWKFEEFSVCIYILSPIHLSQPMWRVGILRKVFSRFLWLLIMNRHQLGEHEPVHGIQFGIALWPKIFIRTENEEETALLADAKQYYFADSQVWYSTIIHDNTNFLLTRCGLMTTWPPTF